MKKINIDESLRSILKGSQVPVLILDTRWHKLFPPGKTGHHTPLGGTIGGRFKRTGKTGQ